LKVIQRHVRTFLDECEAAAPRVVSLCAGDGRDLLDVLAEHPRGPQVRARLVELDPTLAARARHRAAVGGLDSIDVICSDAASIDSYAAAIPAELVLVCGVFGNISDGDVRRTIDALPQLCASDATVIWTRHRYHPDLTPTLKRWFAAAGFAERAFDSPGANQWSVGMHTFRGRAATPRAGRAPLQLCPLRIRRLTTGSGPQRAGGFARSWRRGDLID
jgi:hypothetical protein